MRKTGRFLGSGLAGLALAVAVVLALPGAAHAGTLVNRVATVNPSPDVWEWITGDMSATATGEDLYIEFDRIPRPIYIKWVKCGYTATQDAASSVGGAARYIANLGDYPNVVGTNFINGSCVRIWARAASQMPARTSYPIVASMSFSRP
jgi:hypothetical protein